MIYYNERHITQINTQYKAYGVYLRGQTFTPAITFTITGVEFKVYRNNNGAGNVTAKLYAVDGSHYPTGAALATSAAVDSSTWTTDAAGEFITFTFGTAYQVVAGTEYAVEFTQDGGDASNYIYFKADETNSPYDRGGSLYYDGASYTWTEQDDLIFKTVLTSGYELVDFYDGSERGYPAIILNSANDWAGQSFTPSRTYTPTHISIYAAKGAGDNVGTVNIDLYGVDGSGHPDIVGGALCSGTILDADFTTTYEEQVCTLNDTSQLTASTKYCIVVHSDSLDASNVIVWPRDDLLGASDYAGGDHEWSSDGGSSWITTTTADAMFRVYALIPPTNKWRVILTEYMPLITAHLADLKLENRTASRLLGTDGGKVTSSEDLANWIGGTANQITVTDDGDGSVTISIPSGANLTFANDGVHILDTNASHDLIISPGSDLTADRTLTLTTGDSNRTITLSGNPTLADWFDQAVKVASSPTFAGLTTTSGRIVKVTRITGNTTLDTSHHHVFADTDGGAITVTLPAGVAGTEYRIVNTGSTSYNVTITPNGAEKLLGANSSFTLYDGG